MISLVSTVNSVGLGQASVAGAVGTRGTVEFPVGNGGREKVPKRSSVLVDPVKPEVVEFTGTVGVVNTTGGPVVVFEGTLGVRIEIVKLVEVGGRIVEMFPSEKDETVDQLMDTRVVLMLPVGVGAGAVVLSNGRVVGGISVMLPEDDSVMSALVVTTGLDPSGVGTLSTTMVEFTTGISIEDVVSTGRVRVEVEFTAMELEREKLPERSSVLVEPVKPGVVLLTGALGLGLDVTGTLVLTLGISMVAVKPVVNGTVSVRVVFTVGVSTTMDELSEGVGNPVDAVTFPVLVRVRLKLPLRSSVLVEPVKPGVVVELAGGITPDAPVEVVKAVSDPMEKLPMASVKKPPVSVGMGGMTPDAPVEIVKAVPDPVVKLPTPPVEKPEGTDTVEFTVSVSTRVVSEGGMTPLLPVLLTVAVLTMTVMFPVPTAVVMISVTTVGVTMPSLPVELTVAVDVKVENDPLPEIVVFEISTTSVSEETAVLRIGVSTPLDPVEMTVMTELEATTIVLVLGGP